MPRQSPDVEALRRLIEVDLRTQAQAAHALGCSLSCIERTCKRLGLKTQRTGPRSGPLHTGWKGGRKLVGGYWYCWTPEHPNCTKEGYVAEHRLVQEAKIGRLLLRTEVVHHIDGNRTNNAPENLQHFATNAEHLQHELTGQVPQWTPEGRAKTIEGVRQSNRRRAGSKRGGSERTQTTGHSQATPEPSARPAS